MSLVATISRAVEPVTAPPLDLIEYHDDGIYLGDPNDPEDQAAAWEALMRVGPLIPDEEEGA